MSVEKNRVDWTEFFQVQDVSPMSPDHTQNYLKNGEFANCSFTQQAEGSK
jgi:hypothetical protein